MVDAKQLMESMTVCDKFRSRSSLDLGLSVIHSHFSKIFFSETAWPNKVKLYVQQPWIGGTKVWLQNPGHMTKMAATPIYGKKH